LEQIIANSDNVAIEQKEVHAHFESDEDFMLNAESVMRAWCQWILHFSSVCSDLQLPYDDGAIRCTAINAANVVDAILNRVLGVIEEWRIFCAVDEDDLN
jgi:hypothetical protein